MIPAPRIRVYRALLRLFPRDFREHRGPGMERTFVDMCAEWEEERGGLGPLFWLSLVWDTGIEALGEWLSLSRETIRSSATQTVGEHMSALMSDVRYAFRQLIRQPLYGVMIVVLMTLGIAGNAAVFRVFNGLFLRPLPFENPEQLVDIDETAPQWELEFVGIAYPDFVAWRRENSTFQSIAVYGTGGGNFSADGSAERIQYVVSTHDLDDVLGIEPVLGRFYSAEEDVPDGPDVVLLTDGFWERQFGRDPDVLGRTVQINGRSNEIIGVLPPEADFVARADIWGPLQRAAEDSGGWSFTGLGRLRPDATIEQARADLMSVHKGMIPERDVNEITSPVIASLRDRYLGEYRLGSGFLLAAVGIVLLIACSNIAGLMFARSLARGPEMAVRLAMGAPRMRIVRQLLTESAVLAGIGAVTGTVLGIWGSSVLVAQMADQFPRWVLFDLDWRFVAFTLVATTGAAVLFGLAPALQASNAPGIGSTTRSTASAARRRRMNLLVAGEVALALALLVVGGLSMLDVHRLGRSDPGFTTEDVVTYRIGLPGSRYEDDPARLAFAEDYLSRLEAIPGVTSASLASSLPLSGHWGWFFEVEGGIERGEDESAPVVLNRIVSPGYLETMGVTLAGGRGLDDFDGREPGTFALVVNESFVRAFFGEGVDAVGRQARPTGRDEWFTIVGVSKDVKHYGVDEDMRPGVYQPLRQLPLSGMQVAIRTAVEPSATLAAARRTTTELDAELPLFDVQTMRERMNTALWTRRATSWLIGAFSGVALLLAVAGIYGVISYSVGQRTREISIRMAMGARSQQVLGQVIRQGMGPVAFGVLLGLGGSIAGAGMVSGLLVGVTATDPVVYGGVTAVLVVVAAFANYLPARRAAAVDPMTALRGD